MYKMYIRMTSAVKINEYIGMQGTRGHTTLFGLSLKMVDFGMYGIMDYHPKWIIGMYGQLQREQHSSREW